MPDYQAYLRGRRDYPTKLTVVQGKQPVTLGEDEQPVDLGEDEVRLVTFDEDAEWLAQDLGLRTVRIGRYRELLLKKGDLKKLKNGATPQVNVVSAD